MKTRIGAVIRVAREKLTWKAARWLVKVNVQSWFLQGLTVGVLTVAGVGALPAVLAAKVAAWTVFAAQCASLAKSE